MFDFAISVVAHGEIELHHRLGQRLLAGLAIDASGRSTTDPQTALEGAMLTFAGHQGSAISTMIELLVRISFAAHTSATALDAVGTTSLSPPHGELAFAFSP